jgi:voltage-gated potassium channel
MFNSFNPAEVHYSVNFFLHRGISLYNIFSNIIKMDNSTLLSSGNKRAKHSNNYDEFFTDQFSGEYLTIEGSDSDFYERDDDDLSSFSKREQRCCSCISLLDDYFDSTPCFNGYTRIRRDVWEIVSGRSSKYGSVTRYWPSLIFEIIIFMIIVTNVILSVLISEESYALDSDFVALYGTIEIISTLVFTLEYAIRLWAAPSGRDKNSSKRSRSRREVVKLQHGCCSSRLRWCLAPLSLLDLMVLIGFYIDYLSTSGAKQGLTAVRLLRLLSIFRFERQSKGLKHLGQVLKRKIPELVLAFFVAIILLFTSATIMYAVEKEYPEFSSLSKALWWSAMTITTVGYGDVSPNTGTGRIIASIVAFMGLCLFALPSAGKLFCL